MAAPDSGKEYKGFMRKDEEFNRRLLIHTGQLVCHTLRIPASTTLSYTLLLFPLCQMQQLPPDQIIRSHVPRHFFNNHVKEVRRLAMSDLTAHIAIHVCTCIHNI